MSAAIGSLGAAFASGSGAFGSGAIFSGAAEFIGVEEDLDAGAGCVVLDGVAGGEGLGDVRV